jgi:hypothetical protein
MCFSDFGSLLTGYMLFSLKRFWLGKHALFLGFYIRKRLITDLLVKNIYKKLQIKIINLYMMFIL